MSDSISKIDNEHVPSVSVKIFQSGHPTYHKARDEQRFPEFHVVRCHLARIAKLAGNEHLTVPARVAKLTELARAYADGSPFKYGIKLKGGEKCDDLVIDGLPLLSRQAQAAADQLLSIEKARSFRASSDHGKKGTQE